MKAKKTTVNTPASNGSKRISDIFLFPVIIAMGFIPLIMHTYTYETHLSGNSWFADHDAMAIDLFLAYKSFAIIILAILILLTLFYRRMSNLEHFHWERPFWCLVVYTVFLLLSGALSKYPQLAFLGSYEMFESVLAVLGYMLIFYYSYSSIKDEDNLKWFLRIMAVFVAIILTIGVIQGFGGDPLSFGPIRYLITDESTRDSMHSARESGVAYMTLYNENYMSMYFAMLFPILAAVFMAFDKIWVKVICVVLFVAGVFVNLHGRSTSGWVGIFLGLIVGIIILATRQKKALIITLVTLAVLAIAGVIAIMNVDSLRTRLKTEIVYTDYLAGTNIKDITTNDEEVIIYFNNGKELHSAFSFDADNALSLISTDENGVPLTYVPASDGSAYKYILQEEGFPEVVLEPCSTNQSTFDSVCFTIDEREWIFENSANGNYHYINPLGKLVTLTGRPEHSTFFNDALFSGRGNIWNYCLPKMKKHILTGCGSNLFITDCPQDDYIFKNYTTGRESFSYDVKAHCFYIHTWMENGLIACLAILVLFIWYFVMGIKLYRHADLKDPLVKIGYGFYVGCIGYMVVVLVNDSNVCTAPIFWGCFGISFAINRMIRERA